MLRSMAVLNMAILVMMLNMAMLNMAILVMMVAMLAMIKKNITIPIMSTINHPVSRKMNMDKKTSQTSMQTGSR